MPHDSTGKPINPGDLVTMQFVVREISPNEGGCNVDLNVICHASVAENYMPSVTCNSKLTTLVKSAVVATILLASCLICVPAAAQCQGGSCSPGLAAMRSQAKVRAVAVRSFRPRWIGRR